MVVGAEVGRYSFLCSVCFSGVKASDNIVVAVHTSSTGRRSIFYVLSYSYVSVAFWAEVFPFEVQLTAP